MDLNLRIKGDGSGGETAFRDVASEAQDAAATIEQAFAGMAKKTDAAFEQMEAETTASMKKMGDEGEAAWKRAEDAEKANAAQLMKVKAGLLAVGAAAVAFGVESVHAFAEAQRVQLQLERVAGDLTEAFSQQADALEAQLHIDGELIKQQQTLLLQWGAAPGEIEPAIRAIEDYAAASGKDGVQATKDFLKAVENGDAKLEQYGVNFELTGDKVKDFTALTKAMTSALGGAAEKNANSLQGGLDAVTIAFGNVKEAVGGAFNLMESKLGVLDKVARAMQGIASSVGGQSTIGGVIGALGSGNLLTAAAIGMAGGGPQAPDLSGVGVVQQPAAIHLPGFDPNAAEKRKAHAAAAKEALDYEEKLDAEASQLAETLRRQTEEWEKNNAAIVGTTNGFKGYVDNTKLVADAIRDSMPLYDKVYAAWEANDKKAQAKRTETVAKFFADAQDGSLRAMQAQVDQWARTGAEIGAAFVNALGSQLEALANGGEFDVAAFMGDVLGAAIGVAASALSIAFPAAAPLIGAIGNIANMGVKYGFAALKGSGKAGPKSFHSGGWVGDEIDIPRHHNGAWIGGDERRAILQTEERVASRQEVQNAGGKFELDHILKGGGRGPAVVVNLKAIDSKSAADSFVSDLGDGMRDAQRRGLGALPALLGAGPR